MVPTGKTQNPPRREPFQEELPCFHRVERVFRENQSPRSRGGPSIDQRNLNYVEALLLPGNVAPRFIVYKGNLRILVQVAGKLTKVAVYRTQDILVDLHGQDGLLIKRERRQDISSSPCSHHQDAGVGPDVVGKIRNVVLQMFHLFPVSGKSSQSGLSAGIDVQTDLPNAPVARIHRTEPPSERLLKDIRFSEDRNP